jgi:Ser/Thr protein kinase RdoA (MazF antagonist)
MKKLTHILAILTLALSPAFAGAGDGHGHSKTHGDVAIPATLDELWAAIQNEQAALVAALEKKDGTGGHNIAETLMAYSNALPGKLEGLDEAKLQRITGQTKNLGKVYGDIHHATEDAAFDKSLKDAAKAAAVLKLLEAQLPLKN